MKTLIAGIGNIFFRDDAYGTEVVRLLATHELPPDVNVTDFGIRGMHVAFEMLDGYDLVIFIDAMPRGEPPGTLFVCHGEVSNHPEASRGDSLPDAHAMELHNVLALYERLASDLKPDKRPEILVIGCEPQSTEEGMGLSEPVAAAVQATLPLLHNVLAQRGIGAQTNEKT